MRGVQIVYCCWLAFELVFLYFFVVETRNRTLEETAALFDGDDLSKIHAAAHTAAGEHAEAVREYLRAVARDLEERAVLSERPGRTARELATEAGALLPEHAAALDAGARVFDDVWYGHRPATEAMAEQLHQLERRIARARPRALEPR